MLQGIGTRTIYGWPGATIPAASHTMTGGRGSQARPRWRHRGQADCRHGAGRGGGQGGGGEGLGLSVQQAASRC